MSYMLVGTIPAPKRPNDLNDPVLAFYGSLPTWVHLTGLQARDLAQREGEDKYYVGRSRKLGEVIETEKELFYGRLQNLWMRTFPSSRPSRWGIYIKV